ncbi:MAG: hypothetical protein HN702_05670 [Flavobacteriales bacterium]|nr:hypothetical protein [Flavobacteriales bacterium]MBT7726861.1 hypothetical protein [Flavobacteriales bacterium]
MNLKQKKSVINKTTIILFGILMYSTQLIGQDKSDKVKEHPTIEAIEETIKKTIEDTYYEKDKLERKVKSLEREKVELQSEIEIINDNKKELENDNNEYSQNITPLITEVSNTISHIISVTTDETSLETINSIITIVNYLSLLDNKNQLSNKISKLEKYKEEFQIVNSAHLLLDNLYNKEKNDESINKLKNLNLSGKRNTEKIKILSLLEEYCRMNNKIASLFTKVDGLSSTTDKENQLYKGTNYRYTRNYPFLYQELQKKKDNLKYRSKVKEVNCD